MAIRLVTPNRIHIPDVSFETDEGVKRNRDLPPSDQVSAEFTLANIEQKGEYLTSYTLQNRKGVGDIKSQTHLQYTKCVRLHVTKIIGLEEFGITDGKTLVNHPTMTVLNDMISDLFLKIIGAHNDDSGLDEGLSTGEDSVSA